MPALPFFLALTLPSATPIANESFFAPPSRISGPTPTPTRAFVSRTLGSNMVLQRAPKSAVIFGAVKDQSEKVSLSFKGQKIEAVVSPDGTWRATLPPTPASKTPLSIDIQSSSGESATLTNILFGDVYLCSGQVCIFVPHPPYFYTPLILCL